MLTALAVACVLDRENLLFARLDHASRRLFALKCDRSKPASCLYPNAFSVPEIDRELDKPSLYRVH